MNSKNEILFRFKVQANKPQKSAPSAFGLIVITFVPLMGFVLLYYSNLFTGNLVTFYSFLPAIIIQLLFLLVIAALYLFKYQGSSIPFAALILLMGTGLVLQARMNMQSPGERATFETLPINSVEQDIYNQKGSGSPGFSGLHSQLTAQVLSLALLIFVVCVFSGWRFDWVGEKYMTIFTGTLAGLIILIVLSLVLHGGKFLYSRIPWELAKISLPLALAGFFADNGHFLSFFKNGKFNFPVVNWGPFCVITIVPLLFFVVLGDYGLIMIYSIVLLVMLYVATKSFVYPLIGFIGLIAIPQLITFAAPLFPEYIAGRFELWQHFWAGFPSSEWWDRSYQTANAIFALKAGGAGGVGLGLGHPGLVPLSGSDFIFAEAAEELGFIGTLAIFLLYLSIIITGIHTALSCSRRFDFLAVAAITVVFGCQVFINIGGVINFLPLTGIVLPFLSKGGFSLITFTVLVGLIMAVSHKNAVTAQNARR